MQTAAPLVNQWSGYGRNDTDGQRIVRREGSYPNTGRNPRHAIEQGRGGVSVTALRSFSRRINVGNARRRHVNPLAGHAQGAESSTPGSQKRRHALNRVPSISPAAQPHGFPLGLLPPQFGHVQCVQKRIVVPRWRDTNGATVNILDSCKHGRMGTPNLCSPRRQVGVIPATCSTIRKARQSRACAVWTVTHDTTMRAKRETAAC